MQCDRKKGTRMQTFFDQITDIMVFKFSSV